MLLSLPCRATVMGLLLMAVVAFFFLSTRFFLVAPLSPWPGLLLSYTFGLSAIASAYLVLFGDRRTLYKWLSRRFWALRCGSPFHKLDVSIYIGHTTLHYFISGRRRYSWSMLLDNTRAVYRIQDVLVLHIAHKYLVLPLPDDPALADDVLLRFQSRFPEHARNLDDLLVKVQKPRFADYFFPLLFLASTALLLIYLAALPGEMLADAQQAGSSLAITLLERTEGRTYILV